MKLEVKDVVFFSVLLCLMCILFAPFWFGSKKIDSNAWTYLSNGGAVLGSLLSMFARDYIPTKQKQSDANIQQTEQVNETDCSSK